MKYFTLQDFERSLAASYSGIDNTIPHHEERNIRRLVEKILDPAREKLGSQIIVTSGYRCRKLNDNIGFEFASSNSIIFNVQDCTTSNGKRAIDESNFVITDSLLKPIFVYGKDYAFKNNDYHLSKEKSIFK